MYKLIDLAVTKDSCLLEGNNPASYRRFEITMNHIGFHSTDY